MLQNRVDPYGNIFETAARGMFMGNRGLLHNENREIIRPYKLKAWITCKLEFKGRKRQIMKPGNYTELFFLDEATSFAAGHRPCFECRREDAEKFKTHWLNGNPGYNFDRSTSIKQLDEVIHGERITIQNEKTTYQEYADQLPDGTFVVFNGNPYLIRLQKMYRWTPFGYENTVQIPAGVTLTVLTPRSVVNAFRSGYVPF